LGGRRKKGEEKKREGERGKKGDLGCYFFLSKFF